LSPITKSKIPPSADKDVGQVVAVVDRAGLARRVARLVPIGVVKG